MTSAVDVARRKNIIIPNPSLAELKAQGHFLIDKLIAAGLTKDKVYIVLAKRMNIPESKAHFAKVHTRAQAYRAIGLLEDMLQKRLTAHAQKEYKISKRVALRKVNQITIAEQREYFRKRKIEQLPWYRKLFYHLLNDDTKKTTS